MSGWLLSAAAVLFWLSWALMPGVGVTDPAQIFALVSSQRPLVALLLAPMILSFFVGGALIALALVRAGAVTAWNLRLHGIAVLAAAAGGAMAASGLVPARAVGLTVLGLIALAQIWSGVAASRSPQPRRAARAAIP